MMSWVHKVDFFPVDEEKGRLNPSRAKKVRQAQQKEGGGKNKNKKSCVAFLLCYPGCWGVHILTESCCLTSRINEMADGNPQTSEA